MMQTVEACTRGSEGDLGPGSVGVCKGSCEAGKVRVQRAQRRHQGHGCFPGEAGGWEQTGKNRNSRASHIHWHSQDRTTCPGARHTVGTVCLVGFWFALV